MGGRGYNASQGPIYRDGKIHYCGVTTGGYFRVCSYDIATDTVEQSVITPPDTIYQDDHNSGSLVLLGDGTILAAVKGHGGPGIVYGLSDAPLSAASFTTTTIDQSGLGVDSAEYVGLQRLADTNQVFMTGRRYHFAANGTTWTGGPPDYFTWVAHLYSDDDFATTEERVDHAITRNQHCIICSNRRDKLYLAPFTAGGWVGVPTSEIWFMTMDSDGTFRDVTGADIGYNFHTLPSTGIPSSSQSLVVGNEPGYSKSVLQVLMASDDNPLILYQKSDWPSSASTHFVLYTAHYNGSTWDIAQLADTGSTVNELVGATRNGAVGIIDEADPTTAYVSVETSFGSREYEIDVYETTDYLTWTKTGSLTAGDNTLGNKLVRPGIVMDYPTGTPIVACIDFPYRGDAYNWEGYVTLLQRFAARRLPGSLLTEWDGATGSCTLRRRVL